MNEKRLLTLPKLFELMIKIFLQLVSWERLLDKSGIVMPIPREYSYFFFVALPKLKKVLIPTATVAVCGEAGYVYHKHQEIGEKNPASLFKHNLDDDHIEKESSQLSTTMPTVLKTLGIKKEE